MELTLAPYLAQEAQWPKMGRRILAHHDAESVVVYQAYRPAIGAFAAHHGRFGGEFRLDRMSWIKTSFYWMMHRSSWGTAAGQETILAVWLKRASFVEILERAVIAHFEPGFYADEQSWQRALRKSPVRVQWDPDYLPDGKRAGRRAIQLGLRHAVLAEYARNMILHIEDISDYVAGQREAARVGDHARLLAPVQTVFAVTGLDLASRLGLSTPR